MELDIGRRYTGGVESSHSRVGAEVSHLSSGTALAQNLLPSYPAARVERFGPLICGRLSSESEQLPVSLIFLRVR